MRVAFFNGSNIAINVSKFRDDFTGNFADFYGEGVTSHQILAAGEIAVIGESGTQTIVSPYSKWIWDDSTQLWAAPIAKPSEALEKNQIYVWNDSAGTWDIDEDNRP